MNEAAHSDMPKHTTHTDTTTLHKDRKTHADTRRQENLQRPLLAAWALRGLLVCLCSEAWVTSQQEVKPTLTGSETARGLFWYI